MDFRTFMGSFLEGIGVLVILFPFILLILSAIGISLLGNNPYSVVFAGFSVLLFLTELIGCSITGGILIALGIYIKGKEKPIETEPRVVKKSEQLKQEKSSGITRDIIISIILILIPVFLFVFEGNILQVYNLCNTESQPTVQIKLNATTNTVFNCFSTRGMLLTAIISLFAGISILIYTYMKTNH